MKLTDALRDVHRLFVETAPLIYFIERHPVYIEQMRAIMGYIDDGRVTGVTSVITLTEVLTRPFQQNQTEIQRAYQDILLHSRYFVLVPVTAQVAVRAAELRAAYQLRTPDALQIAAALDADCEVFLTNDKKLQRVRDINVLVLEALES